MLTRSLALVVFGVVAGAAVVLLADPGGEPSRTVTVAPATQNASATGVSADGHAHTNAAALTGDTPCEKSGPPVSEGQTDHGERGPYPWQDMDAATRAALGDQLKIAHDVTLQFPTVATAEAAGYRMTTPYVPCIGAHYLNPRYFGAFDPAHPAMLLYDGTTPDAKMVGLSYATMLPDKPEGFASSNDVWHQHNLNGGLCIKGGVVVGAESTSKEQCQALGGFKVALDNLWMNHVWVADGWPSSWGIFSAEHPDLGGVDPVVRGE
jgi:hypothetical protein